MSGVTLRTLRVQDEVEALAAHRELAEENFSFLLGYDAERPWVEHVAQTERHARGEGLTGGWVPSTFLVGVLPDGALAGRVSLRHRLGEWLAESGGHAGYCVRPPYRGRGIATAMLRGSLDVARGLGLDRLLLTCDDANLASARVIERCGGVFERMVDPARIPPESPLAADLRGESRRYWIDLTAG